MTRQNAIKTQQQAAGTSPLSKGGILQRQCESCGQHTIAGGECGDCGKKKIGLQRKLTIGASNDPLELEADRVADRVMAASPNSVVSSAPISIQRFTGQTAGQAEMVAPASVESVLSSSGSPLEPGLQEDMSQRFGHDFSRVRVHTGDDAARSARDVDANAYTVGNNIVFGMGQYSPKTNKGKHLLAHELVHVIQQCKSELHLQRDTTTEPSSVKSLPSRLITFQKLVKNAGKLRLAENGRALEQWRQFLQQKLTPSQVQTQVHAEEVRVLLDSTSRRGASELALAEQWLQTSGANRRWVLEQQIRGRYRACTGCHASVQADVMDRARAEQGYQPQSPLERLGTSSADQGPRPTFLSDEQGQVTASSSRTFPAVSQAQERINALQPYLRMLGADGYRVLPPETLGSTVSPNELMADINLRITQRQADYSKLISLIDAPDFDYLQLRPIVRDLLPLADADVRQAILKAIDSAQSWNIIESIVVGVASIGLLLLAIFPPTSAIGIGGALALAGTLGAHQAFRGAQNFEQGRLYSLGRGANDVFDPSQQEAADSLMAIGALNIVLGAVGVASSTLGAVRLIRSLPPSSGGLGAVEAVEGRAGGDLYRVTGWGTRDPRVVVTSSNGQVIRQGPLSSFRPSASGGTQSSARALSGTSGGSVYATEGSAALKAQPVPIPEEVPLVAPQPAPAPNLSPSVPVAPNMRGHLAISGGTSVLGEVVTNSAPGRQPANQPQQPRARAYPLLWPITLPPPQAPKGIYWGFFARTQSPDERDVQEIQQARMQLQWRQFRDPDFDASAYHVHHVVPLFLGGPDNLVTNGIAWPGRIHLRGHASLRIQPQMRTPPPPLAPLSENIYDHPLGTLYQLIGFKD